MKHTKITMACAALLMASFASGCATSQSTARSVEPQSDPTSLAGINTSPYATSNTPTGVVAGDAAYWSGANAAPRDLSRSQIFSSSVQSWTDSGVDSGRLQSIQVAAASLGSQAGLAARSKEIRQALLSRASSYDRAFNFSHLMLEPGFLPPVITEGRDAYHQENDNEARASDRIFKIERAARIVSAAPTWRTYLLADPSPAARPNTSVLPKSDQERALWDEWAGRGWNEGARLADQNFEANLARLRQDYQGMLRFKMLYEQGLVSKPKLARSNLGVTGGGDEMAINDRIIRVTDKAALDANRNNWSTPEPRTTSGD